MADCEANVKWKNYPQTQCLTPYSTCTPQSLADVVTIVREAEAANKHVHAFGSKWSFSDCAFTSDYVIDTRQLSREIPIKLQGALRPGQDPSLLYHVEAGITIRDLYTKLNDWTDASTGLKKPLALETMGGASGQTLAGAISTGTHGGDKDMAPLADSVVAIHLVGAGGTQYWIEPSHGITDPAPLRANVVPDVDLQNIIYDDATFNACLVSLGCMGVIYAVVLRVREPYDLVQTTVQTTWQDFKEDAAAYLADRDNRFLQVLLNPYKDDNDENLCLLTTRHEADVTDPIERRPGGQGAVVVAGMIGHIGISNPGALIILNNNGVLDATDADGNPLSDEQRLAKIVDGILTYTPDQRSVLVAYYPGILSAEFPPGWFRGSSYSVMDLGYGQPIPPYRYGYSIELHYRLLRAVSGSLLQVGNGCENLR